MSTATREAIELLEVLPENERDFVLEVIRKLVIAWDPDYTKLTAAERKELDEAVADNERVPHDAINWD